MFYICAYVKLPWIDAFRDKYRDSQSQTFTFYACLILLLSIQCRLDFYAMFQCMKPHLRRRAASAGSTKREETLYSLGLVYICTMVIFASIKCIV